MVRAERQLDISDRVFSISEARERRWVDAFAVEFDRGGRSCWDEDINIVESEAVDWSSEAVFT